MSDGDKIQAFLAIRTKTVTRLLNTTRDSTISMLSLRKFKRSLVVLSGLESLRYGLTARV